MTAGGLLAVDLGQLPEMAVQVHGVRVVGAVAHHEAIARALLQHELALVRVGLAVHEQGVELARAAGDLLEDHLDGLLRSGGAGRRRSEDGVVPGRLGRVDPLRLVVLAGVLDDDAEA